MPGTRAPGDERRRQLVDAGLVVAARDRLEGLTVRNVARQAGLSPGLVFHHLGDKRSLLLAVLDRVIELAIPQVRPPGNVSEGQLLAHLREEVAALPERRELVELFLDFWVMGTREPEVRRRIAAAVGAYRDALRPLAAAAVEADPHRFGGVAADQLAAVAVAFAHGLAVQAVLEPDVVDADATLAALEALVAAPTRVD